MLVFLGAFGFLVAMPGPLLNDPDTQWHVTIGRSIAENRALPWTDTFSHTFSGQPWIAKEWLSQLLLAGASALAGWPGVALLTAFAAAGTLALLYGWLARRLRSSLALALTLAAFVMMAPHLVARPHVLALPVMLLWTCGLADAAERRAPPPWTLLLAMVAWTNLHASFTFGLVIAGLIALDAVWRALPTDRVQLGKSWGLFLAFTVMAACTTPYGYRAMLVTHSLVGRGESLPYMVEWQPLAFDGVGILAVGLMAATLVLLLRNPAENLVRILLVLVVSVMTLRYCRFLDLFALVVPVTAIDPIRRGLGLPKLFSSDPSASLSKAGQMVSALVFALVVAAGLRTDVRPNPRMSPEAALRDAQARGITGGNVYNDIDFGGFLIAHGVKTFIDSRNDQIFLNGFTHTLNEAVAEEDGGAFLDLIDRARVTWALVRRGSQDASHLRRAARWSGIYADDLAEVFLRRCDGSGLGAACEAAAR